jgi:YceI-like domain
MFTSKVLLVFMLPLFMSAVSHHPKAHVRWAVQQNSNLSVQGSSNVNRFSCIIKSIGICDTLFVTDNNATAVALKGCLKIDVLAFNCHNSLIQKDLRKTLKAEEYPKMTIRFLSLKKMPLLTRQSEAITGWVEVELAGTKKVMELNYLFVTNTAGDILLNGARKFCFSDFSLQPPRKMAGLVKIKDEFDVQFQLVLRRV